MTSYLDHDVGQGGTAEICIIGMGPAGLGAALRLSESNYATSTVCVEAGVPAAERFCAILQGKDCRFTNPCQMIGGVGGSSVLSSGKISEYPAGRSMTKLIGSPEETRRALQRALSVFESFVALRKDCKTPEEVDAASRGFQERGFTFRYYPAHRFSLTDLVSGIDRMTNKIRQSGIALLSETEVSAISESSGIFNVRVNSCSGLRTIQAKRVFLAAGRLGGTLLAKLRTSLGLEIRPTHFDAGVRLEFPTEVWPDVDACHNDLKLHFGNARTFCTCKDGWLAPYRLGNVFLMEGHSEPNCKTGSSNLAITVRKQTESTERSAFEAVRRGVLRESGGLPVRQMLVSYLDDAPHPASTPRSSINYWRWGLISNCFPVDIGEQIRSAVRTFSTAFFPAADWSTISVFAPELDNFWPRSFLDSSFESSRKGLYVIGEVSGQFRGILQSFCSGLLSADAVIERKNG